MRSRALRVVPLTLAYFGVLSLVGASGRWWRILDEDLHEDTRVHGANGPLRLVLGFAGLDLGREWQGWSRDATRVCLVR